MDNKLMTVTADHLALMDRLSMDWDDGCEWGSIASDCKRPFGNSDVVNDVSEILGREIDSKEALRLTIELAAIVAFMVGQTRTQVTVGHQLVLPWRAAREL